MSQSKEQILEEFQQRRQAFDQLCQRMWNDQVPSYEAFNCCTCPVCGYPTLSERGNYDLCFLCDWEDDGQDDDEADKVWGGPNGDYSLTEARLNFARYGCMYRPGEPDFDRVKENREENRTLIHLFHRMLESRDSPDLPERVIEVKRFLGLPTNLAEYLGRQALTYKQRKRVISDDRWLGHPVWEGTSLHGGWITPDSALYHLELLSDRMEETCDRCREKMPGKFNRQPCAVCGMPTLKKGDTRPCRLCGWAEQTIQSHEDQEGASRLETARLNFAKYLTSFGPEDEPAFSRSQDNLLKKCLLIRAYLGLVEGPSMNLRMLDEVIKLEKEVFGAEDR
ncbi:cysteine-rich CPCC protein [Geothermobacter ehrlichii]|uniref:Cysteine-rich CPCC protein n=1 Tax=Geothermobacter ehrlichii TaxID=213224 RepID=A0A5D3WHI2_9BACT|nr:CPCC family cysteine-rich protein [Geothermobacter ehrlichii]TYO96782.1 cysteine-rich CPCC protein [Geothermobacter ehrlichii]